MNASNLISGRAWRFTRDGLGDSRIGYADWRDNPLSVAEGVVASAAFPPVFPPARIIRTNFEFGGPVYGEDPLPTTKFIPLTDGSAYDNLGFEVLGKATRLPGHPEGFPIAEFLIASDAGYPAQQRFRSSGIPVLSEGFLLYRVDAMARDQVAALRRRMLINEFESHTLEGTLVALGSSVDRAPGWMQCTQRQFIIPTHLVLHCQSWSFGEQYW